MSVLVPATEAVWCATAPTRSEVATLSRPVFLAPGIRPKTRLAIARAGGRPVATAACLSRLIGPREVLSFMAFVDTARCFGIERLLDVEGRVSPLDRFLRKIGPPPGPTVGADIGCVLIAQDEEKRIAAALSSVRPFVQEIVVVDGGSHDKTVEIARSFDAVIVERPFDHDFGAQQNAGLQHVRCPWTLVIDADEVLEPDLGELLVQIISTIDVEAVNVPFLNLIDEHGDDPVQWPDQHVRLFRTGFRYKGKVHCALDADPRTVHTPLSGPYVIHRKDQLRQHRASLLYSAIEPGQYTHGDLEWIRGEVARLEAARRAIDST
ncbi:MAG: hypothetical protein JWL83_2682 [Actinomycetia bacterium]|nr:hypothetical protein [Actinomycetes bacterium]